MDKSKISSLSLGLLICAASLMAASSSDDKSPPAVPQSDAPTIDSTVGSEKEGAEVPELKKEEIAEDEAPKIIPIGGYLRPEEIAVPPKIPGYRLYQIDRNVKVSGVLDGGGTFDAILPVYVYYPNSKTLNLNNELKRAIDSMGVINAEIATLAQYGSQSGSRRLNDALTELTSTLNTLQAIEEEEIKGFQR